MPNKASVSQLYGLLFAGVLAGQSALLMAFGPLAPTAHESAADRVRAMLPTAATVRDPGAPAVAASRADRRAVPSTRCPSGPLRIASACRALAL